jgi:SapC
MVKIVPVDRQRHAGKGWRRPSGCLFAAADALAPLVGLEFARAAGTLPIAFVEQSGRHQPVAIMSPVPGRNLFVAPTGQWLGTYMPAGLRSYPFRLIRVEGSDSMTFCVDEDSGLIVDADDTTEKLFEADGSPPAALKAMIEFLQQVEQNRALTDLAVAALAQAALIEPWPLTVKIGDQQVTANGLHRIDQTKLNALDEATFLKLRKSSSLILAYAQLISMHSIVTFENLATIQQQIAQRAKPLPSTSLLFTPDDGGTIRFN